MFARDTGGGFKSSNNIKGTDVKESGGKVKTPFMKKVNYSNGAKHTEYGDQKIKENTYTSELGLDESFILGIEVKAKFEVISITKEKK